MAKTLLRIGLCAALVLALAPNLLAQAAKPDGKWSWTMPGRNGAPERKFTLTLKSEGEKLTGKLATPGRNENVVETEITDGKVKGDEVFFTVTREFNGNKMVSKYNGKVTAEAIKGKIEFTRQDQTNSRDWEAKKVKEEKK